RFVEIRYDLNRDDTATFKRAIELLCELYWAAGARVIYPPIEGIAELRDGELDRVRSHELRPSELTLLAFHPLGTARADARPAAGRGRSVGGPRGGRGRSGTAMCDGRCWGWGSGCR